jgi:hypothetical protein
MFKRMRLISSKYVIWPTVTLNWFRPRFAVIVTTEALILEVLLASTESIYNTNVFQPSFFIISMGMIFRQKVNVWQLK